MLINAIRAVTYGSLRALSALLLAGCATAATPAPIPATGEHGETIVYLVRHAEKSTENPSDPDLSPAGFVRADSLASSLRDAGINVIITTHLKRTIETAQPLALKRRITPEIVRISGSTAEHIDSVVAAVRRHSGSRILVVGHSNTIGRIAQGLGAPKVGDLCDNEYSNLIILSIPRSSRVGFLVDSYGPPNPPGDPTCRTLRQKTEEN
ncbi:MAG TPA: phosphoglycerate mutase family protein [Gemmatimonadaceae bacterium]|nr:phosphoglycerate mutase family protein [Gemmatimonadaceae bacterium]